MQWMIYGANGYTGAPHRRSEAEQRGLTPILGRPQRDAVATLAQELGFEHRALRPGRSRRRARRARRRRPGAALRRSVLGDQRADAGSLPRRRRALPRHHRRDRCVRALPCAGRARARSAASWCCRAPASTWCRPTASRQCSSATAGRRRTSCSRSRPAAARVPARRRPASKASARAGASRTTASSWTCRWPGRRAASMRDGQPRTAMTIPWGDVYTAYLSAPASPMSRSTWPFRPPRSRACGGCACSVPCWARGRCNRSSSAAWRVRCAGLPTTSAPPPSPMSGARPATATAPKSRRHLVVPNGYTLTATASLGIVEHLLRGTDVVGYRTPSQLMGAEYVLSLPGVTLSAGA